MATYATQFAKNGSASIVNSRDYTLFLASGEESVELQPKGYGKDGVSLYFEFYGQGDFLPDEPIWTMTIRESDETIYVTLKSGFAFKITSFSLKDIGEAPAPSEIDIGDLYN